MDLHFKNFFHKNKVDYFDYHRYFFSGHEINIGTDKKFYDICIKENLHPSYEDLISFFNTNDTMAILSDSLPLQDSLRSSRMLAHLAVSLDFKKAHRIYFINKSDNFLDVYGFGSSEKGSVGLSNLISKIDKMQYYINFFQEDIQRDVIKEKKNFYTFSSFYTGESSVDSLLSKQELICYNYFHQGRMSQKEIAKNLNISHRTVQKHLTNIKVKLVDNKDNLPTHLFNGLSHSYFS